MQNARERSACDDGGPLDDVSEQTMDRMAWLTGQFGDRLNGTWRIVSGGNVCVMEIRDGEVVSKTMIG